MQKHPYNNDATREIKYDASRGAKNKNEGQNVRERDEERERERAVKEEEGPL